MTLLAFILFVLGILILVLGWRWQNPQNDEILATLKGLAHIKREMEGLQQRVKILESKVEQSEALERIAKKLEMSRIKEESQANVFAESIHAEQPQSTRMSEATAGRFDHQPIGFTETKANLREGQPHLVSAKYRQVLDLLEQGMDVLEIAARLGMSQDAVNMVIRTNRRGAV